MCFSLRTMIVSFILQSFVGWRERGNRLFMKQPTADQSHKQEWPRNAKGHEGAPRSRMSIFPLMVSQELLV